MSFDDILGAALPKTLPTEPGTYRDVERDLWRLDDDGTWSYRDDPDMSWGSANWYAVDPDDEDDPHPEEYLPLERVE